jgi:Ni,Fe-hydrogenase III large subunit
MIVETIPVAIESLPGAIKAFIDERQGRLGLLTSIDGSQLATLMLDPKNGAVQLWETALNGNTYRSLTATLPQTHWFERGLRDLFGIVAEQHPRFKPFLLHGAYEPNEIPLRSASLPKVAGLDRNFQFLEVKGEGIYELPVGPIHAGVIEPGHFRFSCLGETIVNLEIQLGWVHRGVEKRITEVPWRKARFVAEAAASDTAAANALAHAIAIESLLGIEPSERALWLRTLALEIERLAMHIIDVGGMGTDIGMLGVAATMSKLRGAALGMAHMLSGSRFLRAFIMPGGVRKVQDANLSKIAAAAKTLRQQLKPIVTLFLDTQSALDRMDGIGRISKSLAQDFGLVGVAARACGIPYDTRQHFRHAMYPKHAPPVVTYFTGDILAREQVRAGEIWSSLDVIDGILGNLPADGVACRDLPDNLPKNAVGAGIVEAFRGELIHLAITGEDGNLRRYAIKDPSYNNWTAISIAVRDNLIADFPLCNKSLSLSYSGNDL